MKSNLNLKNTLYVIAILVLCFLCYRAFLYHEASMVSEYFDHETGERYAIDSDQEEKLRGLFALLNDFDYTRGDEWLYEEKIHIDGKDYFIHPVINTEESLVGYIIETKSGRVYSIFESTWIHDMEQVLTDIRQSMTTIK